METFKINDLILEINQDSFVDSPRDWDNVGKMVCWHHRYRLGDEQPQCSLQEYLLMLIQEKEKQLFSKNVPDDILPNDLHSYVNKHYFILPLYLYDHGGIAIQTTPFTCSWDSGQIGFIYSLKTKYTTKELKHILEQEVHIYNQYLQGEVYEFVIKNETGDILDSCCGFYGFDECKKAGIESINSMTNNLDLSYCI